MRAFTLLLLLVLSACTMRGARAPLVHTWPFYSFTPYPATDSAKVREIPKPSVFDTTWEPVGTITVVPWGAGEARVRGLLAQAAAAIGGEVYYVILTPNDVGSHLAVTPRGRLVRGYHLTDEWKVTALRKVPR